METKILQVNPEQFGDEELQEACQVLRNDGLVAFPTETVYGLGGNALHKEAANHIYAAKGRPSDNPLIVHISEVKVYMNWRRMSRKRPKSFRKHSGRDRLR